MTQDEIDRALEGKRDWERRLLCALSDRRKLDQIVESLAEPFKSSHVDMVTCFEALGFPLGACVAYALKVGLLLVRKIEPGHDVSSDYETQPFCDYDNKQKTFKVLKRAVPRGTRILIVDDLYERGEQLHAATTLLTRLGANVIGAVFIGCRRSPDVNLDACYGFPIRDLNDIVILSDDS